jgi:hypothetical protein
MYLKITKEMLIGWFNTKEIVPVCPLCKCSDIELGEIIISPIYDCDGTVYGDEGRPMLQLFCANCYHITLFAAKPIFNHYKANLSDQDKQHS